jgi:hypothetical protein
VVVAVRRYVPGDAGCTSLFWTCPAAGRASAREKFALRVHAWHKSKQFPSGV